MLKHYFTIVCLLILSFASCTHDEEMEFQQTADTVQFSTQIQSPVSVSRSITDTDGKGQFTDGDVITLKYNQTNQSLTMQNGIWTPHLTWSEISGTSATFSAFYPQTSTDGVFMHKVEQNQQADNNFEKSDLLYADPVTVNKGNTVPLKFRHLLSCLTVELSSNTYTPEQLASARVQVKGYNQIDVHSDGRLGKLYDYKYVDNIPEITLRHKGNGIFQAIMCPQKLHELDYGIWWLRILIGDKVYNIKEAPSTFEDGTPFHAFEGGKKVTLHFSLDKKGIDQEFGGKTFWVYGLNVPDPESDAWKIYHQHQETIFKHLPWNADAHYGWYDANKNELSNPANGSDMNLCWAAAATNMIHWWLDRNRDYVDRYCTLNKIDPKSIPQIFHNRNNSEIFNLYKRNFENHGSWPDQALKWYFWGEYNIISDGAHLLGKEGAYFKDVFDTHSKLVSARGIITMEDLSDALKKAFKNHQAINFNIRFEGLPNGHALTLWGATFDESGMVTTIYYTENNDGDNQELDTYNTGLIASRVGVYEGNKNFQGRACLANSIGKATLPIENLIFLSLGQDKWEEYFRKHSK